MTVSTLASFITAAPERNHRGIRSPNPLKWVVIHSAVCCDGGSRGAEALARYLRDGAGGRRVSWHYSTDRDSIASSLSEDFAGRHTGSQTVDIHSIAIEMAVYVPGDWSTEAYKLTLENTAKLTADICLRTGIVPEPLTAAQLRSGQPGIISHNLSRIVFGGTTHTDPGPAFPWPEFTERVLFYFNDLETPNPPPGTPETGPLKLGSTGTRVRALQRALGVEADGDFGPITEAAVIGFQHAQKIGADGVAGPLTLERVENPEVEHSLQSSPWLPETLYLSNTGRGSCYSTLTRVWQDRLALSPTGTFDRLAEAATLGFQSGVPGLTADGIVGKQTWGTAMRPNLSR